MSHKKAKATHNANLDKKAKSPTRKIKLITDNDFMGNETIKRSPLPNETKQSILKYLESFPVFARDDICMKDQVTGQTIITPQCAYHDNEYGWDTRDIYHFERYDLELVPDFIDKVLAR